MDQLIELLQQIQELAGVAIEALEGATGGKGGEAPAEEAPPSEKMAEGRPPGEEDSAA
jgi:hypothetical protein